MKGKIIIAGGKAERRRELLNILEHGGYSPVSCDGCSEFRVSAESAQPAALLLLYPDLSEVVSTIFSRSADLVARTVTLLLSASPADNERARSHACRADEFLIEPISSVELIAALDQSLNDAAGVKRRGILKVGDLELDRESHTVTLRAQPLPLDPVHAKLVEFLMRRVGKAFTRREISDGVWGLDAAVDERTVDVVVGRIRDAIQHKVATDPILTVRSVGYAFDERFGESSSLPKKQRLTPAADRSTPTRKKS